jgi:hypothetical protein
MIAPALETVLADKREDAAVLRRLGHAHDADLIEGVCDAVATAAEEYLRWLSEGDAMLQSGWSPERLRRQFPGWERLGHAMYDEKRRRIYRQLIVPHRANTVAARERGRRAAMKGEGA